MRNTVLTATLASLLFADAALCKDPNTGDAVRTGEFQLTFTLSVVAGADFARVVETIMSPDELITWDIYVPDSYRPEKPAGLMVYISPSPSGEIPQRWKSVMDQRNIIWIAANRSGNRIMVARRVVYALVAPTVAGKHYKIDRERIYLSGLSGGGKIASRVAVDYAQLFKGAIYNCGVNFWDERPPGQFELIRQNHYVFVTGTMDHALEQTRKVHKQYLQSGVENSKLMVIRNMTHRNPNGSDFDKAIQYLDSRSTQENPASQPGQ